MARTDKGRRAEGYRHPEASALLRPDVGTQAQFRTKKMPATDRLKRSLRTEFDDSVWTHLSGTASAPFRSGEHGQVAVKVVDDRGNELMVVKSLSDA